MTVHEKLPNQNQYVDAVTSLYLKLPDTPHKPSYNDKAIYFLCQKRACSRVASASMSFSNSKTQGLRCDAFIALTVLFIRHHQLQHIVSRRFHR